MAFEMRMEPRMRGGKGGDPYLTQLMRQKLTPRVVHTLEGALAGAHQRENSGLSREAFDATTSYLAGGAYSDSEVLAAMNERGYSMTRADVAFVRALI